MCRRVISVAPASTSGYSLLERAAMRARRRHIVAAILPCREAMTEHEFRDIGLTRFDSEAAARGNPPRLGFSIPVARTRRSRREAAYGDFPNASRLLRPIILQAQ
jgi:hypothetical protein